MNGLFITLEGGEGAGKSTQIRRLAARLEALGHDVVVTREPGGSPRAEAIREAILSGKGKPFGPFAEALMFSAARKDHLEKTIRPALARGKVVLCDRFADSTRAYQGASGALDPKLITGLERVVVGNTCPDLTLILDLPPETGLARADKRRGDAAAGIDRFESESTIFHNKLRDVFHQILEEEPMRCALINADQDAELVELDIWQTVKQRLGSHLKIPMQIVET
jgi:dTMP kinase